MSETENILRKICGTDLWIKAETSVGSRYNPYRDGEWLYWLKILSIDDEGYCKVNYFNLDFPDDSTVGDVGETYIDDIEIWFPVELVSDEDIAAEFAATDDPDAEEYD
jgi:hypothetical protein